MGLFLEFHTDLLGFITVFHEGSQGSGEFHGGSTGIQISFIKILYCGLTGEIRKGRGLFRETGSSVKVYSHVQKP